MISRITVKFLSIPLKASWGLLSLCCTTTRTWAGIHTREPCYGQSSEHRRPFHSSMPFLPFSVSLPCAQTSNVSLCLLPWKPFSDLPVWVRWLFSFLLWHLWINTSVITATKLLNCYVLVCFSTLDCELPESKRYMLFDFVYSAIRTIPETWQTFHKICWVNFELSWSEF